MVATKLKILKVDEDGWIDGVYPIKIKVSIDSTEYDFTIRLFEEDIKTEKESEFKKIIMQRVRKEMRDYINKLRRRYDIFLKMKKLEGVTEEIEI